MAWQRFGQPRAQLVGKNLVPQALRFANFVEMLCPADFE
jgi:hypothetical protein